MYLQITGTKYDESPSTARSNIIESPDLYALFSKNIRWMIIRCVCPGYRNVTNQPMGDGVGQRWLCRPGSKNCPDQSARAMIRLPLAEKNQTRATGSRNVTNSSKGQGSGARELLKTGLSDSGGLVCVTCKCNESAARRGPTTQRGHVFTANWK